MELNKWTDLLKIAEDAKTWVGGSVVGIGSLWFKFRMARRSELEKLIDQLQEECKEKGIEVKRLTSIAARLKGINNRQRLEIYLHVRVKNEGCKELEMALQKVREDSPDARVYIEAAIAKLKENIIIPDEEEIPDESSPET